MTRRHLALFVLLALAWPLLPGCQPESQEVRPMATGYFPSRAAALEAAILSDDPAGIAAEVAAGADVNLRGKHNITPLMVAVDRLHARAVAELLRLGANPNLKADDGASAVSLAVENDRRAPAIMEQIFASGGDPDIRRPDNDPVMIRFINDRNCERLRYMKSIGANLDITTRAGDPIITNASLAQDWDVVWCLLQLGARFDYETTARSPISRSLAGTFPAPDSPIYPYKVKVWEFLKARGIAVPPLQ